MSESRTRLPARPGRPTGEVALALLAAAMAAPDTVRNLTAAAGVGYRVGRYTASRMLERGELVKVLGTRPAVVAAPACAAVCVLPLGAAPSGPDFSFYHREPATAPA